MTHAVYSTLTKAQSAIAKQLTLVCCKTAWVSCRTEAALRCSLLVLIQQMSSHLLNPTVVSRSCRHPAPQHCHTCTSTKASSGSCKFIGQWVCNHTFHRHVYLSLSLCAMTQEQHRQNSKKLSAMYCKGKLVQSFQVGDGEVQNI